MNVLIVLFEWVMSTDRVQCTDYSQFRVVLLTQAIYNGDSEYSVPHTKINYSFKATAEFTM